MSYRRLRSVMFTSVSVWCITVRAIFGEGIRPIEKKIYLESIATCQILFSKFGLSKPPLPSTTTLMPRPPSKKGLQRMDRRTWWHAKICEPVYSHYSHRFRIRFTCPVCSYLHFYLRKFCSKRVSPTIPALRTAVLMYQPHSN